MRKPKYTTAYLYSAASVESVNWVSKYLSTHSLGIPPKLSDVEFSLVMDRVSQALIEAFAAGFVHHHEMGDK